MPQEPYNMKKFFMYMMQYDYRLLLLTGIVVTYICWRSTGFLGEVSKYEGFIGLIEAFMWMTSLGGLSAGMFMISLGLYKAVCGSVPP